MSPSRSDRCGGFTILEVLVVTMLAVITLGVAARVYADYVERTSTRRAARIFARDLTLARLSAIQSREAVTVRFEEPERSYVVRRSSGGEVVRRRYDGRDEMTLSAIDLQMPGDSVVFNGRGVADLSGVSGSLGTALFRIGGRAWSVSFNSMGASRVQES